MKAGVLIASLALSFTPILAAHAANLEISSQPAVSGLQTGDVLPLVRTVNGQATLYQAPIALFQQDSSGTDSTAWHNTDDLAAALVTPTGMTQSTLGKLLASLNSGLTSVQATATAALTTSVADGRYWALSADLSTAKYGNGTLQQAIDAAAASGGGSSTGGLTQAAADVRYWQQTADLTNALLGTSTIGATIGALQSTAATAMTRTQADARYWQQDADMTNAVLGSSTVGQVVTTIQQTAATAQATASAALTQTAADTRYWQQSADISAAKVTVSGKQSTLAVALAAGGGATTPTVTNTTGSHTFATSETGSLLVSGDSTAVTYTVPAGLSAGQSFNIVQGGAGQIQFVAASGITLKNYSGDTHSGGQWAHVHMTMLSSTVALLEGTTAP